MATPQSTQIKPKLAVKRLLGALPPRAQDIIGSRYGLGGNVERMTLESIGKKYGMTREGVRQIENYAISHIRKSENYKKEEPTFKELEGTIHAMGCVVAEEDLLNHISKDKSTQNHLRFLLVVGDSLKRERED